MILRPNNVDFEINGQINKTHVLNLWFKGISTYVIQTDLDLAGIAVSGGSACTAGSIEPSHVLTAMFGADSPRISEISTYVIQTDLDLAGIAVSGGSACTAGSIEPSHVLTAMFGADSPRISESIRISFGGLNTEEDIDQLIATIVKTVENLKKINGDN